MFISGVLAVSAIAGTVVVPPYLAGIKDEKSGPVEQSGPVETEYRLRSVSVARDQATLSAGRLASGRSSSALWPVPPRAHVP